MQFTGPTMKDLRSSQDQSSTLALVKYCLYTLINGVAVLSVQCNDQSLIIPQSCCPVLGP